MGFKHVIVVKFVVSPNVGDNLGARERSIWTSHEQRQDVKLNSSEMHLSLSDPCRPRLKIKDKRIERQDAILTFRWCCDVGAPGTHKVHDSCLEDVALKRFGDIVVRADGKTAENIGFLCTSGEHQDRTAAALSNDVAQFEPIYIRQ